MTTPTTLTLHRLLEAGYLPEVLPPCFSSATLGAAFGPGKTPHAFFDLCETPTKKEPIVPTSSQCVRYSQARVGGVRRVFSVPNPVHFYRLAKCFYENHHDLLNRAHLSIISLTKPVLSAGKRAFRHSIDIRDRPIHRLRVRAVSKFALRADISRFFPSIYTHSIPWALHTKATAKRTRTDALYGNVLDRHFRNLQDGQTIGIPIGQDISRVIAEIILGYVEKHLDLKRWPDGLRCIDDYELGFGSEAEASAFQHRLERSLAEFELALNPLKTAILRLPQPIMDRWDTELRAFELGHAMPVEDEDEEESEAQDLPRVRVPTREQLLLFFNKAIELQAQRPDQAVLRFSVRRLAHLKMTKECWPVYQDYLLHCGLNQPETLRMVVSGLRKAVYIDKMRLARRKLSSVLNSVICSSAVVGHSSDVTWALWGALLFDVKITRRAASALQAIPDSIVGCLVCEAKKRGLMPKQFSLTWLQGVVMAPRAFYEDQWLLAYEATRNGWIPNPPQLDPCFAYLRAEGVRFFLEDKIDSIREQLGAFGKAKTPVPPPDDDDDSDSEDAFDNWWFDDDD